MNMQRNMLILSQWFHECIIYDFFSTSMKCFVTEYWNHNLLKEIWIKKKKKLNYLNIEYSIFKTMYESGVTLFWGMADAYINYKLIHKQYLCFHIYHRHRKRKIFSAQIKTDSVDLFLFCKVTTLWHALCAAAAD